MLEDFVRYGKIRVLLMFVPLLLLNLFNTRLLERGRSLQRASILTVLLLLALLLWRLKVSTLFVNRVESHLDVEFFGELINVPRIDGP